MIAVGDVGQICIFLQGPLAVWHLMRDNSNLNHSKYVYKNSFRKYLAKRTTKAY